MCFSLVTETSNDPPVDKRHMHTHVLPTSTFWVCYIYLSLLRGGKKIKKIHHTPLCLSSQVCCLIRVFFSLSVLNNTHRDKVTSRNSASHTSSCQGAESIFEGRQGDLRALSDLTLCPGTRGSSRWQRVKDQSQTFKLTNQRSTFPETHLFNSSYLWISTLS